MLRIIGAVLRDEKSVLTVSTLLRGEYGLEDLCMSVPCVVRGEGIERVIETRLQKEEREGLLGSALVIKTSLGELF